MLQLLLPLFINMAWAEEQSWFGLEPDDLDILKEYQEKELITLSKKGIWKTKDKKHIRIKEMSTQHIIFSINKIKRENWRVYYLPILQEELNKRKGL